MSMNFDDLDAHLENAIMEESDIDIEVNVGEGVVEEAAAEAVEERVEIEEPVAEQAEDVAEDEVTEMMFRQIDHMMAVIAERGCSRDIMAAFDTNGSLTAMIEKRMGTSIYVESLDATGDPNSAMTIATLEGLGEMAKKAWEWIKKIFKKIMAFLGRMVAALMTRFGNASKSIGRLRQEYQNRVDDSSAAKDSKKEYPSEAKIKAYKAVVDSAVDYANTNRAKIEEEAKKHMAKAMEKSSKSKTPTQDVINARNSQDSTALDNMMKEFDKKLKACDDKKKALKDGKTKIGSWGWGGIGRTLTEAMDLNKAIKEVKDNMAGFSLAAKQANAEAERLSNMSLDGDQASATKEARKAASGFNRTSSMLGKVASHLVGHQSLILQICNARIMLGKKA